MDQNNLHTLFFIDHILKTEQAQKIQQLAKQYSAEYAHIRDMSKEQADLFLSQLPSSSYGEEKVKRLYFDGCFDLMHSGHFNALRQAKELCETLVVGVIKSDAIAKAKGPPIMTDEERLALASACKWVDEVVIQETYDPTIEQIDRHSCSHVAHGDDLVQTADGKDAYQPFKDAKRMKIFKRTEGISTTDIVGRMLLMTKEVMWEEKKVFQKQTIVEASNINSLEIDQVSIEQTLNNKILNTTRRIMQFSNNKKPKSGDKIVYIDGSFDILHQGHVDVLRKAKELGDFLYVGVYDNETINKIKGKNYPILNLQERVLNLLAIKFVDEVIMGVPYKVNEQLIKNFKIDLVVEGTCSQKTVEDPYELPIKLGIYQQIQAVNKQTADELIERIVSNRLRFLEKYNSRKKKEINFFENHDYKVEEI
ncbi:unnamed protein product [Paramecium octaurelia]|uniref:Cytidyltransferase-like domain-containing protein n=1 Tax=Paramecium octaurelia TaxID=43137 RepID=A0A8S1WFU6_PAROT|nr:unnamed protein product [Paramecium octaurelia]